MGLGLIVPFMQRKGVQTTLISRISEKSVSKNISILRNQGYEIDIEGRKEWIKVESFFFQEDLTESNFTILEASTDPCIITFAVKAGARDRNFTQFLAKLASHLGSKSQAVYISPCENTVFSEDVRNAIYELVEIEWLESKDFEKMKFLESCVDRVCKAPKINSGVVSVSVESDATWLMETSQIDNKLSKTLSLGKKTDVSLTKIKKIVLFNLAHALICIWALRNGDGYLDTYLSRNRKAKPILNSIHEELISILVNKFPQFEYDTLAEFAYETQLRFIKNHDDVTRVLSRFQKDKTIQSFYQDLWAKGFYILLEFDEDCFVDFPFLARTLYNIVWLVSEEVYPENFSENDQ